MSGTLYRGACNECRFKYAMKIKKRHRARLRKQHEKLEIKRKQTEEKEK
jgi:hypothetical protein